VKRVQLRMSRRAWGVSNACTLEWVRRNVPHPPFLLNAFG
jgi:hypothetical protein